MGNSAVVYWLRALCLRLSGVSSIPDHGDIGIVVKFELFELCYWLELYELYY